MYLFLYQLGLKALKFLEVSCWVCSIKGCCDAFLLAADFVSSYSSTQDIHTLIVMQVVVYFGLQIQQKLCVLVISHIKTLSFFFN